MSYLPLIDAAFARTHFRQADGCGQAVIINDRLTVPTETLAIFAETAFHDLAFYLRRGQLAAWVRLLEDEAASANDRFVAETLLRNAVVAARGELALCQDTGTAMVQAWKDESVQTRADDRAAVSAGIAAAYKRGHLRSSQVAPSDFFTDYDTLTNLPAQIRIDACPDGAGGPRYRWLFVAKGGGSANKTNLYQMTKSFLEEASFAAFLAEKLGALGVAACPPYHLAVVVGGTSPEENLHVLKLATTELLDAADDPGRRLDRDGSSSAVLNAGAADDPPPYRDRYWEAKILEIGRRSGLGAQFGGIGLILDARVLRLTRHAASVPVSIGLSCSAHRNLLGMIDAAGVRLEALETDPASYLRSLGGRAADLAGAARPAAKINADSGPVIDLNRSWPEIRSHLAGFKVGDRVRLSGKLLVARDAAHAEWRRMAAAGKPLPDYLGHYPIYYAGPAATPPGRIIGSLGPTTAQRMDEYAEFLMSRGAALLTLAKGNRSPAWAAACRKYGGFYLGTVGGAAALQSAENVKSDEIIDFPELGMEAVRLIEIVDLAAFVVINDRGDDLYAR